MANISNTLTRKDDFDSISEGCFLVMPGTKRQSKTAQSDKRKKSKSTNIKISHRREEDSKTIPYNGFQQLFSGREPIECLLKRKAAYEKAWNGTNKIINDILLDMNKSVLSSLAQFVSHSQDENKGMVVLPYHEIPTALVFAGINTPDHDAQFAHIATHLHKIPSNNKSQINHVALLHSKDCTTLKNMMKMMIERFISFQKNDDGTEEMAESSENEEDEDEDDEDIIRVTEKSAVTYKLGVKTTKSSQLLNYDMRLLERWYKRHSHEHKQNQRSKLVIILQDFESFEPAVLQDFFTICSDYRSRLPIVCVIGIATSTEILHQSLSKTTIGLLRIEKFNLEQSEIWFNRVLEKIFLDPNEQLKFSARPYKFLLDHFYLYDFSMGKATASLKYAIMHHFYGNPLSIFFSLLPLDKADMISKLKKWNTNEVLIDDHATGIRMLRSFREYVESLVEEERSKALRLLEDDEYLLTEVVPELLCDISIYQQGFKLGIHLLEFLQSQFPKIPGMKKLKRVLFLEALEAHEGSESQGRLIKLITTLLRKINAEHIGNLLVEMHRLVDQEEYKNVNGELLDRLDRLKERYDCYLEADAKYIAKMNKKAKGLAGIVLPEVSSESRHTETAKKSESESVELMKKRGTEISKMAIEIADVCNENLCYFLRSFKELPLYEIVYYTNIKLHEKSFAAQPRASIQTALTQPRHYINCECCDNVDSEHLLPTEQDTCILYKLYLECGRMINLYDWFVAFGCILERDVPKNEKLEENEVQARFIRSVAELQFLGFIKPTQRKTDHVARLTWSNI
ncbi:hypothetical protein K501DRAFT_262859 [Backusella circina FSU 941]|nr:hypothetical protein K501DRAFT_262859 [Backusella circina FSU 941]